MTDPMEIARILGRAIAGSTEYKGLLDCEKTFSGNTEAIGLLKEFEQERQKLQNLETLGVEVPPSALTDLESLQQKIQDNDSIKQLMECQKKYEGLLRKVNDEINRQIEEVAKAHFPQKLIEE